MMFHAASRIVTLILLSLSSTLAFASYNSKTLDSRINKSITKIKSFDSTQARKEFDGLKKYIFSLTNDSSGDKYVHLLGLKMAFSNVDAFKIKKADCGPISSQLQIDFAPNKPVKKWPKHLKQSVEALEALCSRL